MTETYITHPGMITVDGGITWYTPDELVAARETDWRVEALREYRNERQFPIDPESEEYRNIRNDLLARGELTYRANVIAEYVRRTGIAAWMNITYC